MAEEQNPPPPKPEELGDGGKKALDAERKLRRDAEQKLADVQKQLDELADKDKPDLERLTKEVADLKQGIVDRDGRLLRLDVAAAKGLTPAQAKRLAGATKEELEADADELIATFPAGNGTPPPPPPPPPGGKPVEDLKPGNGDPGAPVEETDVKKLGSRMFET